MKNINIWYLNEIELEFVHQPQFLVFKLIDNQLHSEAIEVYNRYYSSIESWIVDMKQEVYMGAKILFLYDIEEYYGGILVRQCFHYSDRIK